MIRIYVFIDGQTGNQTNTNAQNAWWALKDHPEAEYIYIIDAANPDNTQFINQFQVGKFPAVVFVKMLDDTNGKTITRINGEAGEQQIKTIFQDVLAGKYGSGNGNGNTPAVIPGDAEELSLGFGLGLGGEFGKWLFWGLIGYGIYQVTKKKRR